MTTDDIHPATFSRQLLDPLAQALREYLPRGGWVLDPFAGLGHKLAMVGAMTGASVVGVEIEQAYFDMKATHPCVRQGDSTRLDALFRPESFDAALTSPVYPNGVADNFRAKDNSRRHTYVHRIRRSLPDYDLHPHNPASLSPRHGGQALADFYALNMQVWQQVHRVLKPGAPFIVNVKDPLNEPFAAKTLDQLQACGFTFIRQEVVSTPGLNHGRNRENKAPCEDIIVVVK